MRLAPADSLLYSKRTMPTTTESLRILRCKKWSTALPLTQQLIAFMRLNNRKTASLLLGLLFSTQSNQRRSTEGRRNARTRNALRSQHNLVGPVDSAIEPGKDDRTTGRAGPYRPHVG